MCTTVPQMHIAISGIEKVVKRFEHVPPLFRLPTRSATGQAVTTYFNAISGPRREGELDRPRKLHLILLDNGRGRRGAAVERVGRAFSAPAGAEAASAPEAEPAQAASAAACAPPRRSTARRAARSTERSMASYKSLPMSTTVATPACTSLSWILQ